MTDMEDSLREHIAETKAVRQVMLTHVDHLREAITTLANSSNQVNATLQTLPNQIAKEMAIVLASQQKAYAEQLERFEVEHERLFHNLQQELTNHDRRVDTVQEFIGSSVGDAVKDIKDSIIAQKTWRNELFTFVKESAAVLAALLAIFGIWKATNSNTATQPLQILPSTAHIHVVGADGKEREIPLKPQEEPAPTK